MAIVGTWTIVALVVGIQNFVASRLAGKPVPLLEATLRHLPILSVWMIATPLIFQSVRRWPFLNKSWKTSLPIHLVFGFGFIVVINAAWPVLYPSTVDALSFHVWMQTTAENLTNWLPLALIVYFAIGGIGHLVYKPSAAGEAAGGEQARPAPGNSYPDQITIRGLNRSFVVPTADIEWIEASGDHVIYHVKGKALKERRRLKEVQRLLDPGKFVRVHRSSIAQVARIREMHALEHGDFLIVMEGGARVRLTRSRRKTLESALGRSI